jgi:hypothetical protein
MRALKDFGFGRASMEERILEESGRLEEHFMQAAEDGVQLSVDSIFNKATLNVVWGIVAGETYDYDDSKHIALFPNQTTPPFSKH